MDGAPDSDPPDYVEAQRLLLHPPAAAGKSLFLLVSVGLFIGVSLLQNGTRSLPDLGILVGVLLFHEVGHALAMRLFGYADVRIFFIPFFGAAASGRRRGVARWKQGVVLLMGPLPGIVIGGVILWLGGTGLLHTAALQLLGVNVLNLLPVAPFDGGQLFQLVLFSRQRHLELAFLALAGVSLIAGGVWAQFWVLALVGWLLLATLPHRSKVLAAARELRALELPSDPAALDDTQRRTLYQAMWQLMPKQWHGKPRQQATSMEDILERATQKPPSLRASSALLGLWLSCWLVAGGAVFAARTRAPERVVWTMHHSDAGGFAILMPVKPEQIATPIANHLVAYRGAGREYRVTWVPLRGSSAQEWMRQSKQALTHKAKRTFDVPADNSELRFYFTDGKLVTTALLTTRGDTGYQVLATSPDKSGQGDGEVEGEYFLGSFLLDLQ